MSVIHHINRLTIKNHIFILINAEEAPDKKLITICDKNSEQTRNKENFLNLIKNIYKKPITNIMLNSERLNVFPVSFGKRQVCLLSPLLLSLILASAIRQEIENKRHTN